TTRCSWSRSWAGRSASWRRTRRIAGATAARPPMRCWRAGPSGSWRPGAERAPLREPRGRRYPRPMATVQVRYIVDDVDAAIAFYCGHLGFHEDMHPNPSFAMLSRGDLRLVLSRPGGGPGGGQAMPDGTVPEPGGWNRFAVEVTDLPARV